MSHLPRIDGPSLTCRAVALAAVASTAACSFATMTSPRPEPLRVAPDCTTSRTAPWVDVVGGVAVTAASIFVGAVAGTDWQNHGNSSFDSVGVVGVVGGLTLIGSGVYGFRVAGRCDDARAAWRAHPFEVPAGEAHGACRMSLPRCGEGLVCDDGVCAAE
jgi:hypothetical protein